MMKYLSLIVLLFWLNFGFSQSDSTFFKQADSFFRSYVRNGKVDYLAVKTNGKMDLAALIDHIATQPYQNTSEKAYLINAYNLFVIYGISQTYPIQSPNEIPAFFDDKNFILNGKLISLNQLENEFLRSIYNDPRLHFVLVCGALSCPPITNFAYTPTNLDKQLDTQTKLALNNENFVYENKTEKAIYLSEIFKWYAKDFGKNNKAILDFINTFRDKPFNRDYKIKYYPYDWTVNNMAFLKIETETNIEHQTPACVTPGITDVAGQTYNAGTLLRKNQFDYTVFNTLYTQTKSNWLGVDYTGNRETFNTHLIQVTYGVSKKNRVNVGLDVNFKSSGKSVDSTFKGISSAFTYKNTDSSRVGITSVGLRLKFQPLKNNTNFTVQTTFLAPTIKIAEGNQNLYWADWQRLTWWNQFFYSKTFKKFQLFTELDLLFRLKIFKTQSNILDVPLSVFFSYFPTHKTTFYVMSQHVPRFAKPSDTDWPIPSSYTASGLGFKYQINRGLNIELLYTNFWRGKNNGLGSTFNFGIKYITK